MADTIERRKNHRLWPNGCGEIVHCRLESIGFHAQEHEVVRDVDFLSTHQFRSDDRITMRTDDPKAVRAELFRPRWTDQEGYIAPGLGKPAAKVATNCAGTDNKDPHG